MSARASADERSRRLVRWVLLFARVGRSLTLGKQGIEKAVFAHRDVYDLQAVRRLELAKAMFAAAGDVQCEPIATEGIWCRDVPRPIAQIRGNARAFLIGRRPALNIVGHLSGIATMTARFVQAVAGSGVGIVATRKTVLGLLPLETLAVEAGGGAACPASRDDVVWVKDVHRELLGGLPAALAALSPVGAGHELHVECRSLAEVREAVQFPVHRLVFDNMPVSDLRMAVTAVRSRACATSTIETEASGGSNVTARPRDSWDGSLTTFQWAC